MIASTSSRRYDKSISEIQDDQLKQQEGGSTSDRSRRSEESHIVDLNVYPSTPGSLTPLGSTVIQIVGSGSLTKGLNNAGLQVTWV